MDIPVSVVKWKSMRRLSQCNCANHRNYRIKVNSGYVMPTVCRCTGSVDLYCSLCLSDVSVDLF